MAFCAPSAYNTAYFILQKICIPKEARHAFI